ncbi:metallothiol transferase FosB [Halobacillus sp. B23F22_1]|uniref:metallothiol transferase FosB n=1 Tax=Halobacillus sp. B23F22_1 TaxID=3459514 RepID=UPI00373EE3D5
MIKGLNHFLFTVSDLQTSIDFYEKVFEAELLVKGKRTAYFDLHGMWLALNQEDNLTRPSSYTHIAFSIEEYEFDDVLRKLEKHNVNILPGRKRDERDKRSIYFTDPDGHMFEFHTGTIEDRINYYKEEKSYMDFY